MLNTRQPPLAFVYDRHVTQATGMLQARMDACTAYLEAKGWTDGGRWLDVGDDALSDDRRAAFDAMLRNVHAAGAGVQRVVLVHDWDRLSRDGHACGLLTRRVLLLGAWVETTLGERRRADGSWIERARLNHAPITPWAPPCGRQAVAGSAAGAPACPSPGSAPHGTYQPKEITMRIEPVVYGGDDDKLPGRPWPLPPTPPSPDGPTPDGDGKHRK